MLFRFFKEFIMNLGYQYSSSGQYLLLPATAHPKMETSRHGYRDESIPPRSHSTIAPTYQLGAG